MSAEKEKQGRILTVSRKAAKKFHSLYAPEHERLCWTWRGKFNKCGYGVFHAGANGEYTYIHAYKAAYFYAKGVWPGDIEIFHECGNKKCVNPAHLHLLPLTPENKDALRKTYAAKLTAAEVSYIKERMNEGKSNAELALQFSILPQTICCIRRGRSWAWVSPQINPAHRSAPTYPSRRA